MRAFGKSPVFSAHVLQGKQALKGEHRPLVHESNAAKVGTSIDFESAVDGLHPGRKRWDYFISVGKQPETMHAVEVHAFDKAVLVGKKVDTLHIISLTCPEALAEIGSWTVIVKGNLPRRDLVARFSADTKIRFRRELPVKELS